jgi:hypothetical protein
VHAARTIDVTGGQPLNTAVVPMTDKLAALPWNERHGGTNGVGPLFYLAPSPDGWVPYSQILYSHQELLFVQLDGGSLVGDPDDKATLLDWFEELVGRHRRHADLLNNHQLVFVVHRPDDEIEHKFTLPVGADIWSLATRLLAAFMDGGVRGWIGEYRNEFEQWAFLNHLYEIAGPSSEQGYISFIPAVDGRWIIKRKWFTEDQPIRRERRDRGVELPPNPDLAAEIMARFGVVPAWSASFYRVRFDVNVESLVTGHGYSVMFDRCSPVGQPDEVLVQCEVEYLRSRTVHPIDDGQLLAEFDWLCAWVRGWLAGEGLDAVEDHKSKLTFLREVTGRGKVADSWPASSQDSVVLTDDDRADTRWAERGPRAREGS